jgi:alkyl sulfatase BDS1-like metallo-beta-lactamase superfamily hydrolase
MRPHLHSPRTVPAARCATVAAVATVEECEQALHTLADRMATNNAGRKIEFDRTLSCSLTDLDVVFGGRLANGTLSDIARTDDPSAQVKLKMTSDDLIDMVDGKVKVASAWASGRIKIDAGMMDLVRLRSIL